jgi:hypothetical protein
MTMNFCERKLDYTRSNFAKDHLVKLFLEQGAKIQENSHTENFGQQHI